MPRTCSKPAPTSETLQVLLGHAWLSTTLIYTHVQRRLIAATPSPLDLIGELPLPSATS